MNEIELSKELKSYIDSLVKDKSSDQLYLISKALIKLTVDYIQEALIQEGSKIEYSSLVQDTKFIIEEVLEDCIK